ncbi:hypothetical protein Bbelb_343190 [Branchiostoma belcheri]|nr:hypothetical protein Bbelb_343190 [Branchiostoma belcheri]
MCDCNFTARRPYSHVLLPHGTYGARASPDSVRRWYSPRTDALRLPTFLHEDSTQKHTLAVEINERGTTFTQKVTLDYENNWALFNIPQHNTVEQQDILFDLNTHLVATVPSAGGFCLIDAMPGDFPSLQELEDGFTQIQDPKARVEGMVVTESSKRVLSEPVQERTSLGPKMTEFCAQKPIFHVETMEFASGEGIIGFPSGPNDTTPVPPPNMGGQALASRTNPCSYSPTSLQVNCYPASGFNCCYRSNSCFYTYQCRPVQPYYNQPTYSQCTGRHTSHGYGWFCLPHC